jgi:hypothetical protein
MGKKKQRYYLLHTSSEKEIVVVAPTDSSAEARASRLGGIVRIDRLDKNMNYLHTIMTRQGYAE